MRLIFYALLKNAIDLCCAARGHALAIWHRYAPPRRARRPNALRPRRNIRFSKSIQKINRVIFYFLLAILFADVNIAKCDEVAKEVPASQGDANEDKKEEAEEEEAEQPPKIFENLIFSARNNAKDKQGELFVIKNNDVFVRTIVDTYFKYAKPADGCYTLDNNVNICTENGKIINLMGNYHNMNDDNRMTRMKYSDEFFKEKSQECNYMKFDMIKRLFIEDEEIKMMIYQIYIVWYFEILNLVLVLDEKDNNKIKAFITSGTNDIGCSPFDMFTLHEEKIIGKTGKDSEVKSMTFHSNKERNRVFMKQSYKKMILDEYKQIEPLEDDRKMLDVVITINGSQVTDLRMIPLKFEWKKKRGWDLLNYDARPIEIIKAEEEAERIAREKRKQELEKQRQKRGKNRRRY